MTARLEGEPPARPWERRFENGLIPQRDSATFPKGNRCGCAVKTMAVWKTALPGWGF